MNLKETLAQLESSGSSGSFLIEQLIFDILRIENKNISNNFIFKHNNKNFIYDGYSEDNLNGIQGPVAIELLTSLNQNLFDKIVNNFLVSKDDSVVGLLIIAIRKLSIFHDEREYIYNGKKSKIYVWDVSNLQKLIDAHPLEALEIKNNLFSSRLLGLSGGKSKNENNWKETRDAIICDVSDIYRSGRFCLFLGAGVSSSAGLPNWDTLLNSLFVSLLIDSDLKAPSVDEKTLLSIVSRLREIDGPSAIALARYLRKGITASFESEKEQFNEKITTKLYELRDKEKQIDSPLIQAIANLCVPTRVGAKVDSIITYNFDDLFEKQLESKGLNFRSIFEEFDLPSSEELPIYHVHGFLPSNRKDYPSIDKSTLVFSEEGYHKIYGEAYHWSNLIQLSLLKESSCLMIGLSLTDPNLRRLLEIAKKSSNKANHYAFMKRIDKSKFIDNVLDLKNKKTIIQNFLEKHHHLNQEVMQELGVNIIWYEDYEEIPTLISKIGKKK